MRPTSFCGLDFGTSNCSIGIIEKSLPVLVPLSRNSVYMPSVAFAQRREYADAPVNPVELNRRVLAAIRTENARRSAAQRARRAYQGLSDAQIEDRERSLMRQAAADHGEQGGQTLADAIGASGRLLFGEDAIRENLAAPGEGFYFKSPKLFLGSDVQQRYLEVFGRIISAMIAEVRSRAQAHTGGELAQVVIGHPVVYSAASGAAGTRQAIGIMEQAARAAGFGEIAFLAEPVAAALNYEMTISEEQTILVVDVGGGTTDCAVVRVGPRRASAAQHGSRTAERGSDVLSYSGDRLGGVHMDFHLAWHSVMPWFGKGTLTMDGLPVPHSLLIDGISVNDFPAQERFRKSGMELELLVRRAREPEKIQRMLTLCRQGLQFRLMRSVEAAKIALAGEPRADLPLDYIEEELAAPITREDLMAAVEGDVDRIRVLAAEAVRLAGAAIDRIFLTGGASRLPAVLEAAQQAAGAAIPVIRGDDFGSVTAGLTKHAERVFGAPAR